MKEGWLIQEIQELGNRAFPVQEISTPTVLVIFGASGDLTHRKLVPALADLVEKGFLGDSFFVIGASRTQFTDEAFREELRKSLFDVFEKPISKASWEKFAKNIFYQPLDAKKVDGFHHLRNRIESLLKGHRNQSVNLVFYLSTAPDFFVPISSNLNSVGLIEKDPESSRRTRLVVEKPFGSDRNSARELNSRLREDFREDQIFRIDHYLGKETVQNILVMRFCNNVFEPLWNNRYVEQVQISVCEDIGVGKRAGFFDSTGITRDIIQNHVMQMLSLMCIEAPISLKMSDSIRDEKVKVLKAIRRIDPSEAAAHSVCGQYVAGQVGDERLLGYLEEPGIGDGSMTETYAALRLEINNWRWAGVPFYIRAGKRLPKRITEISVWFKTFPEVILSKSSDSGLVQNVLSIQVQPREGISLRINTKLPGQSLNLSATDLDFSYANSFGGRSPDAYERLLLDAIKGDATLFTRDDEIEEAWDVLEPFLNGWQAASGPIFPYRAGSWGPAKADELLMASGHSWREL